MYVLAREEAVGGYGFGEFDVLARGSRFGGIQVGLRARDNFNRFS